jgi:predicted nucleic acid-binding protein
VASVVLVDTSAFYALQDTEAKGEHEAARAAAEELEAEGALLLTTDYVLDESYTLLRSVLGQRVAVRFGRELRQGGIEVIQVDSRIQEDGWRIFERYADKDFSFTDCTSFVVMGLGRIPRAFTLDRHFEQYGFNTIPRLTGQRRRPRR